MKRIGIVGLIATAILVLTCVLPSNASARAVAWQEMIPEEPGQVTQLAVFPPKLQEGGVKDNWLAVSHPHKDVHCGILIDDAEGDPVGLDPHSGDIYIDEITNNLIVTAGALSDKCKKDLEIDDYIFYGGDYYYDEELDKWLYTELRARFRDYIHGSGSDLYELEDVPQAGDPRDFLIDSVAIWVRVIGETATKSSVATKIYTNNKFYDSGYISVDNTSEVLVETTYLLNPGTGEEWQWDEINDLQGGVMLKRAECSWIKIWVRFWLN